MALKADIAKQTESVLTTIKENGLNVTQNADGSVTITGTSDKIQSNVFKNTGLFDALRDVKDFQSATFKVNGTPVDGQLLPSDKNDKNGPTTKTGLWTNLQEANSKALAAGDEISYAITVNAGGMSAQYNVTLNIDKSATTTGPAA